MYDIQGYETHGSYFRRYDTIKDPNLNKEILLLGLIMTAGVWFLGGTTLCIIGRLLTPSNRPVSLVDFATGGYLGYLVAAGLLFSNPNMEPHHTLLRSFEIGLLGMFFAAIWLLVRIIGRYIGGGASVSKAHIFSAMYLTLPSAIVATGLTISLSHPIFGWDTLQLYGPKALQFLQFGSLDSAHHWENRHPPTIPLIMAMPHTSGAIWHNELTLVSLPWWCLWVASGLLIFGCGLVIGLRALSCSIITAVAITLPIAENHALVPGYTELFVGVALLATTAYFIEWLRTGYLFSLALAVIVSVSALFIKNTSPFYAILPLMGLITVRWATVLKLDLKFILILSVSVIALVWIYRNGFVVRLFGNEFGFRNDTFFLGGRALHFAQTSAVIVLNNIYHAYFLNQTFSISVLILCLTFGWWLKSLRSDNADYMLGFILATASIGLFGLIFSQFTDYGLRFALPNNDTGNSRFSFPIMMIVPLLLMQLAKVCEDDGNLAKKEHLENSIS